MIAVNAGQDIMVRVSCTSLTFANMEILQLLFCIYFYRQLKRKLQNEYMWIENPSQINFFRLFLSRCLLSIATSTSYAIQRCCRGGSRIFFKDIMREIYPNIFRKEGIHTIIITFSNLIYALSLCLTTLC